MRMQLGKIVTPLALMLLLVNCVPKLIEIPDPLLDATYVFQGKVSAKNQNAGKETGDIARLYAYAVQVQKVHYKKGTFVDQVGKTITVYSTPDKLRPGTEYVFYTEPYMFGKSIEVLLISADDSLEFDKKKVKDMDYARDLRAVKNRLRDIDVVVTANVVKVSPYEKSITAESEHDPNLYVAFLKVSRVLRGDMQANELRILFAASDDIHWYRAPKLKVGDEAVFLLQSAGKDSEKLGVEPKQLTLFQTIDLQPLSKIGLIESALKQ
jgi:hypothetical protein